jgi:hypothetical protein
VRGVVLPDADHRPWPSDRGAKALAGDVHRLEAARAEGLADAADATGGEERAVKVSAVEERLKREAHAALAGDGALVASLSDTQQFHRDLLLNERSAAALTR